MRFILIAQGEKIPLPVTTLYKNTTGIRNSITGNQAGYSNTSGIANSFYGWHAGYLIATTNDNSIYGYDAGSSATGAENAFFGSYAGHNATTGSQNTYIGRMADGGVTTISNATAIGFGSSVSASNKVRLGNSSVSVVEGQVAYTWPSDARFKENVQPDVMGLDFIMKLSPVSYNFNRLDFAKHIKEKTEGREKELQSLSQIRSVGFLAQDVEKIVKETGFYSFDAVHAPANETDNYSLSYAHFVIPLVKGMQEQQQLISKQQDEINQLKAENTSMKADLEKIKAQLGIH